MPDQPRHYASGKEAQEAHEAVRPTSAAITPAQLEGKIDADQHKLYALIWKRAVASQMASAEMDQVSVDVADGKGQVLRATGSIVAFDTAEHKILAKAVTDIEIRSDAIATALK